MPEFFRVRLHRDFPSLLHRAGPQSPDRPSDGLLALPMLRSLPSSFLRLTSVLISWSESHQVCCWSSMAAFFLCESTNEIYETHCLLSSMAYSWVSLPSFQLWLATSASKTPMKYRGELNKILTEINNSPIQIRNLRHPSSIPTRFRLVLQSFACSCCYLRPPKHHERNHLGSTLPGHQLQVPHLCTALAETITTRYCRAHYLFRLTGLNSGIQSL